MYNFKKGAAAAQKTARKFKTAFTLIAGLKNSGNYKFIRGEFGTPSYDASPIYTTSGEFLGHATEHLVGNIRVWNNKGFHTDMPVEVFNFIQANWLELGYPETADGLADAVKDLTGPLKVLCK